METNERTNRIIELTEHPERFTDEQIRELLSDEECRKLYDTLVEAARAMAEEQPVSDGMIDEEWRKFSAKHFDDGGSKGRTARIVPLWRSKIAAACAALLIVSGVALAFIATGNSRGNDNQPSKTVVDSTAEAGAAADIVTYDDARLDSIMTDVSARYGIEVDYENDTLRRLRFHLKWDRSRPIADFMEVVNGFEGISMSSEGGKVIVKEVFEDETENEQDNE